MKKKKIHLVIWVFRWLFGLLTKLSSWKVKTLSISGRLTLLKLDFLSLDIYFLPILNAHMLVFILLESMCARFFWEGEIDG